jgi:hypothetical protein
VRTICLAAALPAVLLVGVAAPAQASRAPHKAEAAAIKKAFFKGRSKSATKIVKVRVSTVDKRYAGVTYSSDVKTSTVFKAPSPVLLKKSGKKWKAVGPGKVPAKVKKDLKKKTAVSDVTVSGEVSAHLTRGAACSPGGVSIYDPVKDLLLSIQQSIHRGSGFHPALAVDTVVALYRNKGTELAYESGQPTDANAQSGYFYRDPGGWGIVDAELAVPPVPDVKPLAVSVKGTWDCR